MVDEIKNEVDVLNGMGEGSVEPFAIDKDGAYYFLAQTENISIGSQPTEEESSNIMTTDDRSVRIRIDRTDDGCLWAFDNDASVYRNVKRRSALLNNGYKVMINKETKQAKDAKKYLENILIEQRFRQCYDNILTNKSVLHWSPVKKMFNDSGDIIGLVELEPKDCKPIRNLSTGEIGGSLGLNVNPDNLTQEVALVQEGKKPIYDYLGNVRYEEKYYYFSREEIMFFTMNERGKFKGVSPVRRVLRLVECKKTLENIVELICRRYGPQVWIVIGNKDVNLSNVKIPQKYFRNGDVAVDRGTALENYRKEIFKNLQTKVQQWSTGETLAQFAEYGVEPKVLNPSSSLPRYVEYIQMYADFIKNGIFGLDFPGRVDVTSSIMQDKLPRDVEDSLALEQENDWAIINREYIKPLLKQGKFAEDSCIVVPNPLDRLKEDRSAKLEQLKSAAVFNYLRGGATNLPPDLVEKWGFDIPDIRKMSEMEKMQELKMKGMEKLEKMKGGNSMSKDKQHPLPSGEGQPGPISDTSRST